MSQDFVNDLPTELLRQVFRYLNDFERPTAANVCKRWFDILPSERYLETLEVDYERLETEFDDAKRYRSISIVSRPNYHEKWTLQRFLHDEVVMSNLEELYIDLSEINWFSLFRYSEEHYLPNLRQLTLDNCNENFFRSLFQWRYREHNVPIPKWILSDKIEILEIIKSPSLVLPKAELFPNLRSLTLIDIEQIKYEDSFQLITRRLKELNIISTDSRNIEKIVHNARDLESLKISGDLQICTKTCETINDMKKLKQLTLTIPITGTAPGLSLPFLEKLEVSAGELIPLENVPNLRSLCIRDKPYRNEGIICKRMVNYFRLFGQQLHHLSLYNMFLARDYVSQICTLSNLQRLKVSSSDVEFADVEKICQSIGNLKVLRLELCTVAREIILCVKNSDRACECKRCMGIYDPYAPGAYKSCEELETCFSHLSALYVDCAITKIGGLLIQQAIAKVHYQLYNV